MVDHNIFGVNATESAATQHRRTDHMRVPLPTCLHAQLACEAHGRGMQFNEWVALKLGSQADRIHQPIPIVAKWRTRC